MKRFLSALSYTTIALNGLLVMVAIFADKIQPGNWLQVSGRLHPLVLHLPIGFFVLFAFLVVFGSRSKAVRISAKITIQLTAFLLGIAALAGIVLSREGGYQEDIVNRHLNTGIITSLMALSLSLAAAVQYTKAYFKIATIVSVLMLTLTGHWGAVLTHGENYVLAPVTPKTMVAVDSSIYGLAVSPILQAKCTSCHNPGKKKGELILTTAAGLQAGGESGPVLLAGKPQESELLKRCLLPTEHDDHMPPAGKPQLTDIDILVLEKWIETGASFEFMFADLKPSDSLHLLTRAIQSAYGKSAESQRYNFPAVDNDAITRLNTPTRTVKLIAAHEPALKADFFLAQYFKPEHLDELNDVSENIAELNLAGLPIDDALGGTLLKFVHVESLNLNNTKISDKTVEILAKLENLRIVRLSGTGVTEAGLQALAKSKALQEVYAWNTAVKPTALQELLSQHPKIQWYAGEPPPTDVLRLTPPILKNEVYLLNPGESIVLKHNLPGTDIRYTLDDSKPDSLASPLYQAPITISKHQTIRALAVKMGWLTSTEIRYPFFVKGIKPVSSKLLSKPDKDYKAQGAETFVNETLGDVDNYRDENWIAFRENEMSVVLEFDKSVKEITIIYLQNIGSFIMPPQQIECYTGTQENNLKLIARLTPQQPKDYLPNGLGSVNLLIPAGSTFIKLNVQPVGKLPTWHSGKGQKGWLMVSEIIFH